MSSDAELSNPGTGKEDMDEFSKLTLESSPSGIECYEQNKEPIKECLIQSMMGRGFSCTDGEVERLVDAAMKTLAYDESVTRNGETMYKFISKDVEHESGESLTAFVYLGYKMAFDAKMQTIPEISDCDSRYMLLLYNDSDIVPVITDKQDDLAPVKSSEYDGLDNGITLEYCYLTYPYPCADLPTVPDKMP